DRHQPAHRERTSTDPYGIMTPHERRLVAKDRVGAGDRAGLTLNLKALRLRQQQRCAVRVATPTTAVRCVDAFPGQITSHKTGKRGEVAGRQASVSICPL